MDFNFAARALVMFWNDNEAGYDRDVELAEDALREAHASGRAELMAEYEAELLAIRAMPTPFNNPDL